MSIYIASLVKIPLLFTQVIVWKQKYWHVLADNSVKIWQNLPISNPKPDLHSINSHTKFGENPLMFTQVIIQKWKMDGRTYVRRTDIQRETIIPHHYCVAGYKNRHFIIQERFNKLIYGTNTIMECGTWQPVNFQLVSRSWNEMIFLSSLWINVANINSEVR